MAKLGLTPTQPLNLEENFDIMVGSGELDEIDEGADFPEIDTEKGKGKGFKLKIFAGVIGMIAASAWLYSAYGPPEVSNQWNGYAAAIRLR